MPEQPSSMPPESEGRSSFPPPGELLDQLNEEPNTEPPYSAMTEWDRAYQKEIEKLTPDEKLLSAEREKLLAEAIRRGREAAARLEKPRVRELDREALISQAAAGQEARDELVVGNLRLAAWFTRHTMDFNKERRMARGEAGQKGANIADLSSLAGGELDYSDRMQLATLGLLRAAERYEGTKGRFSTYAMYHMEQVLTQTMFKGESPVNYPINAAQEISALKRARRELEEAKNEEPSIPDLAQELGWSAERTAFFCDLIETSQPISYEHLSEHLDRQEHERIHLSGEEEELLTIPDRLPHPGVDKTVADEAALWEMGDRLDQALGELTERERQVLEFRFGLATGEPMTLVQIGNQFGVIRERIRQIEAKALAKMRHPLRTRGVQDLVGSEEEDPMAGQRAEIKLNDGDDAALGITRGKPRKGRKYYWDDDSPGFAPAQRTYTLQEFQQLRADNLPDNQ